MKKRIFLLSVCLLTLAIAICLFTACDKETPSGDGTSQGDTSESDGESLELPATEGLVFALNFDGETYYVDKYAGKSTTVNIPSTYDGKPVTMISDGAFESCSNLTSVIIGNGVETIGPNAFRNCNNLTSIVIGKKVTSIGENAFLYCYKLVELINKSSLNISKSSRYLGYVGLYALEIHTGKSKVVNKDGYLFYTYDGVNHLLGYIGTDILLSLPNDYNGEGYEIYHYAFYCNDNITSVTIENSTTKIGDYAFSNCRKLTSIKYRGTEEMWNKISKGYAWNDNTGGHDSYTITYNYTGA